MTNSGALHRRSVLRLTDGNRREAARLMGIPRTTLTSKIKRFGLPPKSGRATPG
jgi:DNA-binding protein Fis